MKCKTCAHPQCPAIDQALLTRTHTLEALSQQYGLTVSSLHRHKQHLVDNLDRARDRLRNSQQLGQLLKLNAILDKVERAVDAADADGDVNRVLRGAGVGARIIKQMSQMEINLELDTVHRIISNPQWLTQASLLPTDPRLITDIHQTIADIGFSPCPDPPAALTEDDGKVNEASETIPATGNQKPETINSKLRTRDSKLLHDPDTADSPPNQRQTSGKLPKKISFIGINDKQYQQDTFCEKNSAKTPLPSSLFPGSNSPLPGASPNQQPETENQNLKISPDPCPLAPNPSLLDRVIQAFPFLVPKSAPASDQPRTPTAYDQEDCLIPLKNDRHYRGVLF